jgi:hypothetical protein
MGGGRDGAGLGLRAEMGSGMHQARRARDSGHFVRRNATVTGRYGPVVGPSEVMNRGGRTL